MRLIEAVKNGDREYAAALLGQNVDVNATEGDGATALHWAAFRDDLEIARRLVQSGANVKSKSRDTRNGAGLLRQSRRHD